jgi:type IV secretory pathway VirB3-like protein
MIESSTDLMNDEDTLHAGVARPAKLFGLPYPAAIFLLFIGYIIQTNLTGLYGLTWAASIVGPCWILIAALVRHDTYGAHVAVAWLRMSAPIRGQDHWGGASCSPLPALSRKRRTIR